MTVTTKCLRDGWQSEDEITLFDETVLIVTTSRNHSGKLVTSATAFRNIGPGTRETILFTDYRANVETTMPPRVTASICEAQHKRVLTRIAEIKATAIAHQNSLIAGL
jgi:hypothetical protein